MEILISILISSVAVFVVGQILPGVHIENFGIAVVVAVVMGLINAVIRPILFILTLPINILTLGLFTFVVIALCVLIASSIVPGFTVDGFWWAMAFGLTLALVNWALYTVFAPQTRS